MFIEDRFRQARGHAAQGNLVVVREDGKLLLLPGIDAATVKPEMTASIERLIPSTTKRRVAVIGDVSWAASDQPTIQAANRAIPFYGMLMGISYIGHAVWIFQVSGDLLSVGCSGADVLLVDSERLSDLPSDWKVQAAKVMRNPQILVHDRASYKLLLVVPNQGPIVFGAAS